MIPGILLAAGSGTRFGSQKLLALTAGRPVIVRTLENCLFSGLSDIFLILGHESEKVKAVIGQYFSGEKRVNIVFNPDYQRGIISSFISGLSQLSGRSTGAMMLLADMPFVRPATIDRLMTSWNGSDILLPEVNGRTTHPRIFPADVFDDFFRSGQMRTGREILIRNRARIKTIGFGNDQEFRDIDTVEDLMYPGDKNKEK